MANTFRLQDQGKLPEFYKRYVDDTLSIMPNVETAESFLSSLNESHPSVSFTMELGEHDKLPFLGTEIRQCNGRLETRMNRNQLTPDYYYITRATSMLDTRSHCLKQCWIVPLKCHLHGNCSTWNVIISHRRSPDFSTQPSCYNLPSVILSPKKFLAS